MEKIRHTIDSFSIKRAFDLFKSGKLIVKTKHWFTTTEINDLIEAILKGIPVPTFVAIEDENGFVTFKSVKLYELAKFICEYECTEMSYLSKNDINILKNTYIKVCLIDNAQNKVDESIFENYLKFYL